jgi:antitoxin VapB
MPYVRHVKLLRSGHHQVIRIPVEFELPGEAAMMHREGDRLVIEPLRERDLLALLKTMEPFDGDFAEINDPPPPAKNIF